ncbi:dCTP deaminase [Tautonia rosea]|uniref:dCTP deaminase n=1 Tax=Tautonia rosea TaxID=2728037 RepID=UPI0014730AC4|nr:dCTP deaminase [Tautonia rosea]
MILSDREIEAALEDKQLIINPRPNAELWSSTAIDLTLHGVMVRWKTSRPLPSGEPGGPKSVYPARDGFNVTEMAEDEHFAEKIAIPRDGFALHPKCFVLGYTRERIYLPERSRIAARVEGKSSLARLGIGVHVTAPTIHAGFGFNKKEPETPGLPIQLEIFNLGEFVVYLATGMPICQLIREEVREVPSKGYHGRFSAQEPFRA